MKLTTPRWWYERHPQKPLGAVALRPLSWVWAEATARKLSKAAPVKPPVPVICVGNLTVGGTGKTPIVQAIAARLVAKKTEVHLLSRGHGGKLKGPVRVDPYRHTADDVGDEPLMLAREFPVWISRDRPAGARAAAKAGAKVIVMDDGHQNPSLKKALSLIVVDGETRDGEWPFGDGSVFPAGPMREPLAAGLERADAVVLLMPPGLIDPDPDLMALFGEKPALVAHLQAPDAPPAGPLVGFAGVGKPWKVERALRAAGAELSEFAAFPDHAVYDHQTLDSLIERAKDLGAKLVTTEKDWARLPPDRRDDVTYWPVRARFEDEKALDALISGLKP